MCEECDMAVVVAQFLMLGDSDVAFVVASVICCTDDVPFVTSSLCRDDNVAFLF